MNNKVVVKRLGMVRERGDARHLGAYTRETRMYIAGLLLHEIPSVWIG